MSEKISGVSTEPVKILDHGFVRLVSHMGGDAAVVNAARVSHGQGSKGEEADRKLIKFMLTHDHGTPFEHAVFTFHVKVPIFVMRQWIRHRMASYNEISYRYTEAPDEFYVPSVFKAQDTKNKQGSAEDLPPTAQWEAEKILRELCEASRRTYLALLDLGVSREQSRNALTVNYYTQFYLTLNARGLMHFLRLRTELHAQLETRLYANELSRMFKACMPWTFEAFLISLAGPDGSELKRYPALMAEAVLP